MKNKKQIKIILNGEKVYGFEGETILEAASRTDVKIPQICKSERLETIGSCRMCVVEVEGMRGLQASCSTPIREGMVIKTNSPRVLRARRVNMELILANHD